MMKQLIAGIGMLWENIGMKFALWLKTAWQTSRKRNQMKKYDLSESSSRNIRYVAFQRHEEWIGGYGLQR
jgi:hypothetical protein